MRKAGALIVFERIIFKGREEYRCMPQSVLSAKQNGKGMAWVEGSCLVHLEPFLHNSL